MLWITVPNGTWCLEYYIFHNFFFFLGTYVYITFIMKVL